MADIPNYAPNFQIPLDAFRKQDPYSQILPSLIAGQQHGAEMRKRQLLQSLFQNNPELSTLAQIDPAAALKIHQENVSQKPLYQGPDGQFSLSPQAGFSNLGNYDKEAALKVMEQQAEKRQSQKLQEAQIQGNLENRKAMTEIMAMIGQGRLDDAKARLDELSNQNRAQRDLQVQGMNAAHPYNNFFRSMTGRKPLIQNPDDVTVTNFKVR